MRDALTTLGVAVLVAVLSVTATRLLWPRTETLRLPARTDTVQVTNTELDSIVETVVKWRERVTTDTVNLVRTRWRTRVDTVVRLVPRWYLTWAKIAQERGGASRYGLVKLGADSAGIYRQRMVEEHVTPGPVTELRTTPTGLSVGYGTYRTCGGWSLGGLQLPGWVPVAVGAAGGIAVGVQF